MKSLPDVSRELLFENSPLAAVHVSQGQKLNTDLFENGNPANDVVKGFFEKPYNDLSGFKNPLALIERFSHFVATQDLYGTTVPVLVNPKIDTWVRIIVREICRIGPENIKILRGKGGSGKTYQALTSAGKQKKVNVLITSASHVSCENMRDEAAGLGLDLSARIKTPHSFYQLVNAHGKWEGMPAWEGGQPPR